MLIFHCILYRFQLSAKFVMKKNNNLLKDLFQFLEKLLKYHQNSAVVTAVFHVTTKLLGIIGTASVI